MKFDKVIYQGQVDQLNYVVFREQEEMGSAAAQFVADQLISTIAIQGSASIILATGASQFSFLEALKVHDNIDWSAVTVFHLDEYTGLSADHPASFRRYLRERILEAVQPKTIHYIAGDAPNIEQEIERYSRLLQSTQIDLACIGIGENGHIAFNDPPVADFHDKVLVKQVALDMDCRLQQVGEGWFDSLREVPCFALTLTIPAIMRAKTISCVVPDERKARAVRKTLKGPISTNCPASILRTHADCTLFLDSESWRG